MAEIKDITKISSNQFEVTETEARETENKDVYVHKFKSPFKYEDKTYTELSFDWGKLTGEDALAIEDELTQLGKVFITPEFSAEYLIRMAAKACTTPIGSDLLTAMPLRDFNNIRSKARSFLLRLG